MYGGVCFSRGSLYRIIHRPHCQIDEKRRIKMALDVVCNSAKMMLIQNFHLYVCFLRILTSCLILGIFRQKAWIAYTRVYLQLCTVISNHQICWLIITGMWRFVFSLCIRFLSSSWLSCNFVDNLVLFKRKNDNKVWYPS